MKRFVSGIMLVLLSIGLLTSTFNIQPVKADTKTICVDDDNTAGPWDGTRARPNCTLPLITRMPNGDFDMLVGSQNYTVMGYRNSGNLTDPVWMRENSWDISDIPGNRDRASPSIGDLDNDGDYDLLISNARDHYPPMGYKNIGNVTHPMWQRYSAWDVPDLGAYEQNPELADLDDDGDLDLLIGGVPGFVCVFENNGTAESPSWNRKPEWDVSGVLPWPCPAVADLDSDGDFDIMMGQYYDGNITAYGYENNGTACNPSWKRKPEWDTQVDLQVTEKHKRPALVDIDNDGDYDLICGVGIDILAYENNGTVTSPSWKRKTEWDLLDVTPIKPGGNWTRPVFVDLDADIHDIAVISVAPSKTVVGQGYSVWISATVVNHGNHAETLNVTIYANTTIIQTKTIKVGRGGLALETFLWNTIGFAKGNYTISAYATPVPGEIDIADNTFIDGAVEVIGIGGYFIIIAGTHYNSLQTLIDCGCNELFRILLDLGYGKDKIYYLNPSFQDIDGDGFDDRDDWSSAANLQYAIETWASSKVGPTESLFLYTFDHGGTEVFCIKNATGDFSVSSAQLESWLNNLEGATKAPIHVIYAACHSGSFIDELSKTGRVIISSCRPEQGSQGSADGKWELFSQPFWREIQAGHSVAWSFEYACEKVEEQVGPWQTPLLDDNGDDVGHTAPLPNGGDGYLAFSLFIGSSEWVFPWTSYVVAKQFFAWPPPPTITLWAKVENKTPLIHVRALIQPPDWTPPPPDTELALMELECFEMTDLDHDGNFTVDIPAVNFTNHATGPSDFKFIITTEEENGMTSIPLVTGVGFTETGQPSEDNTSPTVHIERPLDGRIVQDTIRINGTATDDVCLQRVEFYVDGNLTGVIDVPFTSNSFFDLDLDTTTISNGPRTILVKAFDTSNNSDTQTLTVFVNNFIHDITVTDIAPLKTIVGQGFILRINVTVANHGSYTETFNVTVCYNETAITLPNGKNHTTITLTSGNSTTITFTWNTTGFAKGNYTISAYATPVPGETDTDDNTYPDGWVVVTWLGDLDADFDVDQFDFWHFCSAFIDYYKIHVKDPLCDFDDDCDIDQFDYWTFCSAFIDYYKTK